MTCYSFIDVLFSCFLNHQTVLVSYYEEREVSHVSKSKQKKIIQKQIVKVKTLRTTIIV